MATNTKSTTTVTATKAEPTSNNTTTEKSIENTASGFISQNTTWLMDNLESFRVHTFNSPYIFYPILVIFVFFVVRFLWRKFF